MNSFQLFTLFLLFSLLIGIFIFVILENRPYNHQKTIDKLNSKKDFESIKEVGILTQIETGLSFYYILSDRNGKLIKNFSPDWSYKNIIIWGNKFGYEIIVFQTPNLELNLNV